MSYDELRQQNRGLEPRASLAQRDKQLQDYGGRPESIENMVNQPPMPEARSHEGSYVPVGSNHVPKKFLGGSSSFQDDAPPLMSGTPVGNTKTSYGDEGFS